MELSGFAQQVWEASERRRICSIKLKNEPSPRIIHPHGICQSPTGTVVLVSFQVSGYSKGGKLPGYRNLPILECAKFKILDTHFIKRHDFNPDDTQYGEWVFHI